MSNDNRVSLAAGEHLLRGGRAEAQSRILVEAAADRVQAMVGCRAADGGNLLVGRRERAGRQVGVVAAAGDRPAVAEGGAAQRQSGLRGGAAKALGDIAV